MKIRTYTLDAGIEAANNQPHLAQLDLGRSVFMSFFGKNSAEATEKAQAWYDHEVARQRRLEAGCVGNTTIAANAAKIANNVAKTIVASTTFTAATVPSDAKRGAHFGGSAWVINKANVRRRVPEEDAAPMLASGDWQRGGPRSTWKKV